MKREFNFISHLDNQDVAYVLARKKDYYAQLIQRFLFKFMISNTYWQSLQISLITLEYLLHLWHLSLLLFNNLT